MKNFKIALCQIIPGKNKAENVCRALDMISEVARNGAALIVFPEIFYYPFELLALRTISGDENEILTQFQNQAKKYEVYICTGSMVFNNAGKRFNTSHLISPKGEVLLNFSKCHLFDAEFESMRVKESLVFSPGTNCSVAATELGTIGINICYDIRFPEMARHCALLGAELLLVPAVFNQITGPAHWKCFMQTRAVENQLYLVAVSQGRSLESDVTYKAYGHSMVVSPWGEVLAEAGEDETILYVDLDPALLAATRKRLPLLQHRRDKLYNSFNR
jgi:omega-amidase